MNEPAVGLRVNKPLEGGLALHWCLSLLYKLRDRSIFLTEFPDAVFEVVNGADGISDIEHVAIGNRAGRRQRS
jgi:hypothetical protein